MTQTIDIQRIVSKGTSMLLAYDHGLEHGPTDFDDRNVDPAFILDIAQKGGYDGVILQKGIAEKYWNNQAPLIIKLNGKTNLLEGDPIAPQVCTVKEALEIGACAVGYTIYVGSLHEADMFREFERIQEEAHDRGIPVIAWMYPRGAAIKDENSRETLAYAARIGLELGADVLKMKYNGSPDDLSAVVKAAGKARVLVAGGSTRSEAAFLHEAQEAMQAGCLGMAVGRNVWQHHDPLRMTQAVMSVVREKADVQSALDLLR